MIFALRTVKMNSGELEEFMKVSKTTNRMWRNFWIRMARDHGYSVADIAKEYGISIATVYAVLKKK